MPPLTLLQLNPCQALEFPTVNLRSASINLNMKNVSGNFVAYNFKTTAAKKFLARPSMGVVAPGEDQDIQIILQPQQTLPESNKDRFLVQAVEVDSADVEVTRDFWISVPEELLQKHILSVVFKPSEEAEVSPGAADASSVVPPSQSPSFPSSHPSSNPSPPSPSPPSSFPSTDSSTALITSDLQCPSAFPPPAVTDFEATYNDLLQSYLALEKHKTAVANELTESQKQVETLKEQKTAVANKLSESQQQVETLKYKLKEKLQWARKCPWGFFN